MQDGGRKDPRVRLVDVARAARVSTMTASRALRGERTVDPQLRDAVTSAAARLGYVPNQAAVSLRSQRSKIIAVIVPTLTASIFSDTIRGISDTAETFDYQLMIGESSYDLEREERIIAALLQRRPDAIIVVGVRHTAQARALMELEGIPIIEIWDRTDRPIDSVVGFSNFQAAYDITRGLLVKGYASPALATGPVIPGNRAAERSEGFRAALRDAGVVPGPSVVVPYYGFLESPLTGGNVVVDFLGRAGSVDCLFCTNELIAIGSVVACGRRGIKVPADIAIAGFGDVEAASIIMPALTTVRIRGFEMGRRAAEIVKQRLAGEDGGPNIVDVGYEIMWRDSA